MKKSLIATLALMLAVGSVSPAFAAIPKAGATCSQSGAVVVTASTTSICQLSGTKLAWSKPLKASSLSSVEMADSWIKVADASAMMTGAFGTFINNSGKSIKIIAAYAPTKLSKFGQLHEVVMKDGAMKMQEKAGGFVIPAKGKLQLRPGGNHTMVMGLVDDIVPGSITKITYVTSTGARFTKSFLGKIYAGGSESYDATPASTSAITFSGTGTGQAAGITVINPLFRVPDMMSPFDAAKKTYTTGGFMVIENKGTTAATLVGGTADFGGKVITVQETVGTNQWTDMPNGLVIGAGSSLKMRMKGYHVTIKGVPADVAGKKVNVTLKFSDGSTLATKFQFVVIPSTDATYGFAK